MKVVNNKSIDNTGEQQKNHLGLLADSGPVCCAESEYHLGFAKFAPV